MSTIYSIGKGLYKTQQTYNGDDTSNLNPRNSGCTRATSGRVRLLLMLAALCAAVSSFGICPLANAQDTRLDPVTHNPPGASQVIRLYPGVAPGSEGATQVEASDDGLRVRNVTVPELLIYKPKAGTPHTGAAMIIAPGGGFQHLSIINEGSQVAERLAASGITGVVLKYRTSATAAGARSNLAPGAGARDDFAGHTRPAGGAPGAPGGRGATGGGSGSGAGPGRSGQSAMNGDHSQGHADAAAAVRYVRDHAAELGITPDRVGFVGFSAGASLSMTREVTTDLDTRPNFVGAIYSPAPPSPPPSDAPPLFLAVAADDTTLGSSPSLKMAQDWQAAKLPIELHVFNSGAHGFGMTPQGKTSDHWIDEFIWWLTEPNGIVKLPTK